MISFAATVVLCFMMSVTIFSDLKSMRIPNWTSVVGLIAFALLVAWTLPMEEVLWRIGIAFSVLLVGFMLFALNVMGAGDVKIFAILMLFIPSAELSAFMLLFAGSMILGILVVLGLRRFFENSASVWAFLRNERRMPLGLSIGAAGLIQSTIF